MNKKLIWYIVLLLLPLLTVGLAAMPDSVTVLREPVIETCSFFDTLSDGSRPMGLAFSGLTIFILFAVLVVYVITKKKLWLNVAVWVSLIAATLAVLPLLLRTEPMVIPNVGVPLMLCVEALLCSIHGKQDEKQIVPEGKRLK